MLEEQITNTIGTLTVSEGKGMKVDYARMELIFLQNALQSFEKVKNFWMAWGRSDRGFQVQGS